MKKNVSRSIFLILGAVVIVISMTAFFFPNTAKASSKAGLTQDIQGDKLIFGSTYTLNEGQTLDGNLLVFGGNATLMSESLVKGDAVVMGGTLSAGGTIAGSIVTFGGIINLSDTAVVEGDVFEVGGDLEYDAGARIEGEVISGTAGPFQFAFPQFNKVPGVQVPNFHVIANPIWDFLWYLFRSMMWAALAVLVVLFLPQHTNRAARAAMSEPVISAGLGLLTIVVAPIVLVAMAITIIGIPLSLLSILLLVITWVFGVIVIGTEVGKRLARMLKVDWALAVSAGIGTFLLTLVVNGINELVLCIGWLAPALVGMVGLGAVLLTRYGTQKYPPVRTPVPPSNGGYSPTTAPVESNITGEPIREPIEPEPDSAHASDWIVGEPESSTPPNVIEPGPDSQIPPESPDETAGEV
jgi:hypothetical protein